MYKVTRWVPWDRGGRICWLLNELEVPHEVQTLDYKKDHDNPEYRKLHPLGSTPVLQTEDLVLFESGAICLYLADKHPEKGFLPASKKAFCYQWLMYAYATLEPVATKYWDIPEDDAQLTEKKAAIDIQLVEVLAPLENVLAGAEFICGDKFTVADVPLAQTLYWLRARPVFANFPNLKSYMERMKARPAAQQAELFVEPS